MQFDEREAFNQNFCITENPDSHQIAVNHILTEIAKGSQKNPRHTRFSLNGTLKKQILTESAGNYLLRINLSELSIEGENMYRGFDITTLLLPDRFDIRLRLENRRIPSQWDTLIAGSFSGQEEGRRVLANFPFTDTSASPLFSLSIPSLSLWFSPQIVTTFDTTIQTIDNYYLSELQILKANALLSEIDLDKVDRLPLYDFQLRDIEKVIQDLYSSDYEDRLSLTANDPIGMVTKLNLLNLSTRQKRDTLDKLLSGLHHVYFSKGVEFQKEGKKVNALEFFEKAIQVNPYFTPAHERIAYLNFSDGKLLEANRRIQATLSGMKPDNQTLIALLSLSDELQKRYLFLADSLIEKERFPESIELLEEVMSFCKTTPGVRCNETLSRTYARAHYGMYNGYLIIARKALENKKNDLAETYTNEAVKYQKQHPREIVSPAEAYRMYNLIATSVMQSGKELLNQKNFRKALIEFEIAERICSASPDIEHPEMLSRHIAQAHKGIYDAIVQRAFDEYRQENIAQSERIIAEAEAYRIKRPEAIPSATGEDTLMARIRYKTYKEYIYRAEQYINFSDFSAALKWLNQARDLEIRSPIVRDKNLPDLCRKAAKPVLMQKLSNANTKLMGGFNAEAGQLLREVNDEQDKFLLLTDDELNTRINELKEKVYTSDCLNTEKEVEDLIKLAWQNVNAYDYQNAVKLYNTALSLAESKPDCHIKTAFALEMRNRYQPAATYQNLSDELLKTLEGDLPDSASAQYNALNDFYHENNLQRYALKNQPLIQLLLFHGKTSSLKYFANQYIDSNKPDEAFNLLKKLKDLNATAIETRLIQEKIASLAAKRDKQLYPDRKSSDILINYTGYDKYYKHFNRAYTKAWKKE